MTLAGVELSQFVDLELVPGVGFCGVGEREDEQTMDYYNEHPILL